jgi:phosphohistidine phosphatase
MAMPKTLLIHRHAKSSWDDLSLSDFERPLNQRGKADAPRMGKRLKMQGFHIDLFLSSPARRAIETARIIASELGAPASDIQEDRNIYMAGTRQLLKIVNQLNDSLETVILFGHNPGFTELIDYLSGTDVVNLPTCGVAVIEFPLDSWAEVSRNTGSLVHFDYPKKN